MWAHILKSKKLSKGDIEGFLSEIQVPILNIASRLFQKEYKEGKHEFKTDYGNYSIRYRLDGPYKDSDTLYSYCEFTFNNYSHEVDFASTTVIGTEDRVIRKWFFETEESKRLIDNSRYFSWKLNPYGEEILDSLKKGLKELKSKV